MLTEAAISGQHGRLPSRPEGERHHGPLSRAGTGMKYYRKIKIPDEVIEGLGEGGMEGEYTRRVPGRARAHPRGCRGGLALRVQFNVRQPAAARFEGPPRVERRRRPITCLQQSWGRSRVVH